MALFARNEFARLFRTDEGQIDRRVWRRGAAFLGILLVLATLPLIVLGPATQRGLDQRDFFDLLSLSANVYVLLYALALILLAISWVNLTAKRLRDRGLGPPVGLAGVFPLLALFDGALHWLQPRLVDAFAPAWLYLGDAIVVTALLWTIAVCIDLVPRR